MRRIERALISVYDKTGIVEFARGLASLQVEILATGSTYKLLASNGIPVREVSDYTGFPEILDGRVKTLHPRIAGGLLAIRSNPEHMRQAEQNHVQMIDLVCVNLYPFAETIRKPGVSFEEVIENIDIGGPSMIRAAAKNFQDVAVRDFARRTTRLFWSTHVRAMAFWTGRRCLARPQGIPLHRPLRRRRSPSTSRLPRTVRAHPFPANLFMDFEKISDLRYGENPHQKRHSTVGAAARPLVSQPRSSSRERSFPTTTSSISKPPGIWSVSSTSRRAASSSTPTPAAPRSAATLA